MKKIWILLFLLYAVWGYPAEKELILRHCGDLGKFFLRYKHPGKIFKVQKSHAGQIQKELENNQLRMAITTQVPPEKSKKWKIIPLAAQAPILAVNPENTMRNISRKDAELLLYKLQGSWRSLGGPRARIHLYRKTDHSLPPPVMRPVHQHPEQNRKVFASKLPDAVPGTKTKKKYDPSKVLLFQTDNDSSSFSQLFTDPYGIACFDVTRFHEDRVPLLSVDNIPPTAEHIRNGKYPLTTIYYLILPLDPTPEEQKLQNYILSRQFAETLFENGWLPLYVPGKTEKK